MSDLCCLPHPELGWPCTEPAGHPTTDHDRSADVTSSPELPVPDAAVDAFTATDPMAYGDTAAMVRAIAGPVVAAELRRLALVYDGIADGYSPVEAEVVRRTAYSGVAMKLRTRADELEGRVSMR